jgi:hypothetical protein
MGSIVGYLSIPGVTAAADLSTKQYHAVKADSTERRVAAITNANAESPMGVLQDDPDAADRPADVAYFGVVKVELGGTVSYGDDLACNNDGELITDAELTDGSASDLHHIGVALEAGVDGDIIDMLLHNKDRIGSE